MESYTSVNIWMIRLIGLWDPEGCSSSRVKFSTILRCVSVGSQLFLFLPAAMAIVHIYTAEFSNLLATVEIISLTLSSFVVVFKTITCFAHRKILSDLLKQMSAFWNEATQEDIEAAKVFANTGKRLTLFYAALGAFDIIVFIVQPLHKTYFTSDVESHYFKKKLPFDGWWAFDTQSTLNYGFMFFAQIVACIMSTAASVGVDCFLFILILHACGHLRGVSFKLKHINIDNGVKSDKSKKKETGTNFDQRKIVDCITKFDALIIYLSTLEKVINLYLLVQSLSSTIVICLTGFMVSKDVSVNAEFAKYIFYWGSTLFQIFLYCWVGEHLQTQGKLIGESAYSAYPTFLDPEKQQLGTLISLQMIMILSSSYSYFTILRASNNLKPQ